MNSYVCNITSFPHISEEEKSKKWFLLLNPLISARKSKPDYQESPLIQVLNNCEGTNTWVRIKNLIEFVLNHVENAESIFSRASRIKTDKNPDGVINDMFAELRAGPYLKQKGFKKIYYQKKDDIDFKAEFDGNVYNIEVAYVRGPSFKTQVPVRVQGQAGTVKLDSKKLLNRLKSVCDQKEKQLSKHGYTENKSLVLLISDLAEIHEFWLNHKKIQGKHPIQYFISTRKVPTVIFGAYTVYEPFPSSLNGVFGKLNKFNWDSFKLIY